ARAAMAAAQAIAPDAAESRLARGEFAYFCENDWPRALTEYQQAESGLPNDARLLGLIGYTHRRLGHWQAAVTHLEHTLALDPADLYDASQLAAFLIALRRYEQARDLALKCVRLAPRDAFVLEAVARAQFGLDGDAAAFHQAAATRPPANDDPAGLRAAYRRALRMRDYAAAARILTDPRLKNIDGLHGIALEPVELHRALVAFADGQAEQARNFADLAIADYRQRVWTPRQQPYVAMAVALAKALGGRADEAVREAEVAVELAIKADAYAGVTGLFELGRICAVAGRTDAALAALKRLMAGPSPVSPNEIRLDPLWLSLSGDSRFEEILKSAKLL
ncbi:MAG: hypothetical protein ABIR80_21585, partial [Opitutaceae bacterium]